MLKNNINKNKRLTLFRYDKEKHRGLKKSSLKHKALMVLILTPVIIMCLCITRLVYMFWLVTMSKARFGALWSLITFIPVEILVLKLYSAITRYICAIEEVICIKKGIKPVSFSIIEFVVNSIFIVLSIYIIANVLLFL